MRQEGAGAVRLGKRGRARRKETESGQALVEFALAITLLLLLLVGIMEFGLIFHAYLVLEHASLEGARVGALGGDDAAIAAKVTSVLSGTLNPQAAQITITPPAGERRRGKPLTVELRYPVVFLTPLIADLLGNGLNLKADAVIRIE